MATKLWVYAAIFIAMIYLAWRRGRRQARGLREVAQKLGLESDRNSITGTVRERAMHARRVQKGRGRHARHSLRFELELRSPPSDLRLATEGAVSTLSKLVGLSDIHVGDELFDKEFLIRAMSEGSALVWLSPHRRDLLMALRKTVNAVRIEEGWLEFEIPADPYQPDEIESALNFAVGMAECIDDPADSLQQPTLAISGLRATRWKWAGCLTAFVFGLPFLVLAVFAAFFFVVVSPKLGELNEANEQRRRAMGVGLQSCIEGLELTWDVDLSVCADEAAEVDPESAAEQQPLRTYNELLLRKAVRVDLDREAAVTAIENILAVSRSEDRPAEQLRYAWDAGLPTEYARLEVWSGPVFEPTARAVATLGGMTDRVGMVTSREVATVAAQCLLRVDAPRFLIYHKRQQVRLACREVIPPHDPEELLPTIHARTDDDHVAQLEADPDAHLDAVAKLALRAPARHPKATLYVAALKLARGEAVDELPLAAITEVAAPAPCDGAWAPGASFGDPEVWREAAKVAGPLADIMRTHAIAQDHAMGRFDILAKGVQTENPHLATCVAQMEIAAGDPAAAIERLAGLEDSADIAPRVHYTRAQAHFIQRQWVPAAQQAVAALQSFPMTPEARPLRDGAALFALAAQLHARDSEVAQALETILGPASTIDQLREDDPVGTARWFAAPARQEFPKADIRWGAPAALPLVPGAELASFHIAGEFATDANVEYWLDTLIPLQFDPFGVATGRLHAAKLRDDAAAEKSWEDVHTRLRALVDSPSAARLRRNAFP